MRDDIEALVVAVAALGLVVLLAEPWWKPEIITWLMKNPVTVIECEAIK